MEYRHERFILNRLCEFADREIESKYLDFERSSSANMLRRLTLLMGAAFVLLALADHYLLGNENSVFVSLAFRCFGLLIAVIAFFLIGKFRHYERALLAATSAELLLFAIYLLELYIIENREKAFQLESIILFILAISLIPNKWKNCLIAGCVVFSGYLIFSFVFAERPDPFSLARRGIYLGACLAVCAAIVFDRERSRRKRFAAEKFLEFMTITDKLTGIYNRVRFEFVLGQWIKNNRHDPFSLLFFDIDDFKKVNDRFGHAAGDRVLAELAKIVSTHIRDEDVFARWGGEEFVVLFSGIDTGKAVELAERLRGAVEMNPFPKAGRITISIGVAQYRKTETIADIVNRADEKMYEAKKAGKNRVAADAV